MYTGFSQKIAKFLDAGEKKRAGGENRTLATSLEGWSSTTELRPQEPTMVLKLDKVLKS